MQIGSGETVWWCACVCVCVCACVLQYLEEDEEGVQFLLAAASVKVLATAVHNPLGIIKTIKASYPIKVLIHPINV